MPLVDVAMGTYNHEKFIAQALESVLTQKTDFSYRIIICDDFSTDNTRSIILSYVKKFPDKIVTLFPERHYGMEHRERPYPKVLKLCTAKYVAMLEGDDYWISTTKLQEQVDFLDSHPEFVMCFTNGRVVNEDGDIIKESRLDEDRRKNLSQAEIISGIVPPANTVVYRNNVLKNIPDEFYSVVNADIFLFSLLTEYGDAGYLDINTGSYRMHAGGVWSEQSEEYSYKKNLKTRCALLKFFKHKYKKILLSSVNNCYVLLLGYYVKKRNIYKFILTCLSFLLHGLTHMDTYFRMYLKPTIYNKFNSLKKKH
jgi:glycosyltransferase involved in cell wall biosynthesis